MADGQQQIWLAEVLKALKMLTWEVARQSNAPQYACIDVLRLIEQLQEKIGFGD